MEGLILEVKADISQFEAAMTRLQTLTQGGLAGFNESLFGLGEAVGTALSGLEEFSALIQEQDQSWTASASALTVYKAGLIQIKSAVRGLADQTAQAVSRVKELQTALEALPKRVEIEIVLTKTGTVPTFHQGGLVAGPVLSPPLAHSGMYLAPPGPEERDVRVLTGEYVLSRAGVRTLGLAALRAADQGRSAAAPVQVAESKGVENHYHIESMIRVDGSLIADETALSEFADRIGRELDWQAQGRTG